MLRWIVILLLIATPSFAANFALEIIQPQASLDTKNRFYKAYPGLEYNVRAAVIGGAYPYTYSLTTKPTGMTINSSTGEITWSNPTATGSPHSVTMSVTDAESATQTVSWTVTVTTSGFKFVDAVNGHTIADGGTGAVDNPWKVMSDVYGGTDYASKTVSWYPDDFIYWKTGTYTVGGYQDDNDNGVAWNPAYKAKVWLAYPGNTPVIDMEYNVERSIKWIQGSSPVYYDGLTFDRVGRFCLYVSGGLSNSVFRNLNFLHLHSQTGGSLNQSYIFMYAAFGSDAGSEPGGHGQVIQDSTFSDIDHGCAIKLYQLSKMLIEDNTIDNIYDSYAEGAIEGIALKQDIQRVAVRHNRVTNYSTGKGIGGNMDSQTWSTKDNEIIYNYIMSQSTGYAGVYLNENYTANTQYISRNTIVNAPIRVRTADATDGIFYISNNVIQAATQYSIGGDASRTVVLNDLTGASGLVDSNGLLINRSYVGTYGWETSATPTSGSLRPGVSASGVTFR